MLSEELLEKDGKLNEFRTQEVEMRKQIRLVDERQANMEVELQRKIEDERSKMADQIGA